MSSSDRSLIRQFGIEIPEVQSPQERFYQQYPLLSHVDFYYTDIKDVIEYIQLKEGTN